MTPKRKPASGQRPQADDDSPTDNINPATAIPSDDAIMGEETTPCPPPRITSNRTRGEAAEDLPPPPPPTMFNARKDALSIDDIFTLPAAQENEWLHGLLAPYEPDSPQETAFSTHVALNGGFFPQATISLDRALLGIGPTQRKAILDEQDSTLLLIIFNSGRSLFSGSEDKVSLAIRAKLDTAVARIFCISRKWDAKLYILAVSVVTLLIKDFAECELTCKTRLSFWVCVLQPCKRSWPQQ